MRGFATIAARQALWVFAALLLALLAVGALLYGLARERVLRNEAAAAQALTAAAAAEVATALGEVQSGARSLARSLARFPDGSVLAEALAREAVQSSPRLASITVAYAPGRAPLGLDPYAPVYHRAEGTVVRSDLAKTDPGYAALPWFERGKGCFDGCWGAPGVDEQGRWVVDFTTPIQGDAGLIGVVRAQLRLDWLRALLQRLPRRAGAFATVIDRQSGLTLAHERVPFVEAFEAEFGSRSGSTALSEVTALIVSGQAGTARAWSTTTGQWTHYFFAPVGETRWMLGLAVPEHQVLAEVGELAWLALALVLAVALLVAAPLYLFLRRSLAPLRTLTGAAERIARGRLDFDLPATRTRDEVGRLTAAFSGIREDLRAHIEELRAATAERERMDSELQIARQLQQSLLPPARFDDPLGRAGLAAALTPARSVGGDLYAWFQPDGDHLCCLIGDVADKGIPAALLMARVLTLAKSHPLAERDPSGLLRRLNAELCNDNEAGLFVTLLAVVLHLESGATRLASAGHDPPLLHDGASVAVVALETGPALGLDPGAEYPLLELELPAGALLLAWTDGITEARRDGDEGSPMFGEAGLRTALAGAGSGGSTDAGSSLRQALSALERHAGPPPWQDDVAMLALHWRGAAQAGGPVLREGTRRIPARLKDAMAALDQVTGDFLQVGAGEARVTEIRCAIEEALVNCVRHAYPAGEAGEVRISWSITRDRADIVIEDDGIEFNPLEQPAPDLEPDPARRGIGGLGIHLLQQLAKRTNYRRIGTHNRLELGFDL